MPSGGDLPIIRASDEEGIKKKTTWNVSREFRVRETVTSKRRTRLRGSFLLLLLLLDFQLEIIRAYRPIDRRTLKRARTIRRREKLGNYMSPFFPWHGSGTVSISIVCYKFRKAEIMRPPKTAALSVWDSFSLNKFLLFPILFLSSACAPNRGLSIFPPFHLSL